MTIVVIASGVLLAVAALLTLIRLVIGPTVLDRAVAFDVLLAIIVIALGVEAVYNRHTSSLPILLVLSIVGFVSTIAIVRFTEGKN
ncbi:monovalent cation/H+ antiporter complex subunit F [Thermostaphylospora chromogena]|uniref:Multisubunit sodium/proton antiporter, MrpF subunit n=1 Tax=Thermostaphylospora chromogena TaxID=35622 RepID=A0A1H1CD90_9ACTN|nr:monovalent cation/H+ antiporter complex subunit F [Thermostaphylospora chromogena]SDQ61636.1 multisubunit sodium/proton antiporter, MrpF subunit [Thermostaphylospora chromogena]